MKSALFIVVLFLSPLISQAQSSYAGGLPENEVDYFGELLLNPKGPIAPGEKVVNLRFKFFNLSNEVKVSERQKDQVPRLFMAYENPVGSGHYLTIDTGIRAFTAHQNAYSSGCRLFSMNRATGGYDLMFFPEISVKDGIAQIDIYMIPKTKENQQQYDEMLNSKICDSQQSSWSERHLSVKTFIPDAVTYVEIPVGPIAEAKAATLIQ